jgi:hypothetical protein
MSQAVLIDIKELISTAWDIPGQLHLSLVDEFEVVGK